MPGGQPIESSQLGNNLEALIFTGTGDVDGTGNRLDNVIVGTVGDNVLDGMVGADTLQGGKGDDTYHVDDLGDVLIEANGQGIDLVIANLSHTLGNHLDNLTLVGGGRLNGTGNGFANSITGNDANNTLDGKAGNDFLTGGGGSDVFAFTTKLNATSNLDTLTDFVSGTDRIALGQSIFTHLAVGGLHSDAFVQGPAATTASHRIMYDETTGILSYDRDGSGGAVAIAFAQVTPGQVLSYTDFDVF